MEIIEKTSEQVKIRISIDELNTLMKVLNKVYNTLSESDLKVRLGVKREEVLKLSSSILHTIKHLD